MTTKRIAAGLLLLAGLLLVPGAPAAAVTSIHYVAIGDSITHGGYGSDPVGRAWRAEFDLDVTAATGVAPTSTVLAIGGWSTSDVLPQLAAALLDAEHRQHVDLVVIALGTNDAAGSIPDAEARYGRIITTALDGTPSSTRVALTFVQYSVPPASAALTAGEHAMDDAIFRCAAARGWTATPAGPRFGGWIALNGAGAPHLSADGVHPDAAGYIQMGDLAYDGVRGPLGWAPRVARR